MVNESRTKTPLTESQALLLEFIKGYLQTHGFPPSYREIQKHFGYKAVGTVQDHVRALIQKGVLQKTYGQNPKRARALVLSGEKIPKGKVLPIYGEIAAGGPRESVQTDLGSLLVGEDLVSGDSFALRVVGNSMIDIGIFEGDLVIVEKTPKVKNGDIVVALVDGETTVKRYREKNGKVFLIPENREMKPIEIKNESFHIQGKVTGLQRKF